MVPMAQRLGQKGFEGEGTGANPSLFLHFFNLFFKTENRDTAPPPLMYEKFRHQSFYETKMGSPTTFFGTVTQNLSDRKPRYTPLMHKTFRHPKFSETPKGSPTKFFGTVRQKISDKKS